MCKESSYRQGVDILIFPSGQMRDTRSIVVAISESASSLSFSLTELKEKHEHWHRTEACGATYSDREWIRPLWIPFASFLLEDCPKWAFAPRNRIWQSLDWTLSAIERGLLKKCAKMSLLLCKQLGGTHHWPQSAIFSRAVWCWRGEEVSSAPLQACL